ncbi:MAG: DUF308 domain-containing protein [Bifidobacteriaceae bacterium]|nr:DUF308 domain-containing protein [Bifidobacteriaceae bacterium]
MSQQDPLKPDAIYHIEDDDDVFANVSKTFRRAGVVVGIIELVIGIVMLFWPTKTLTAVVVLLAVGMIVLGACYLAAALGVPVLPPGWRTLAVLCSVLFFFAGIAMFKAPQAIGESLIVIITVVLGMVWILEGVASLFQASFTLDPSMSILYGLISIIAGIVVLATPAESTVFLFMFVAIALVVLGIVSIVRALTFGRRR